jgi:hypothetical protein
MNHKLNTYLKPGIIEIGSFSSLVAFTYWPPPFFDATSSLRIQIYLLIRFLQRNYG